MERGQGHGGFRFFERLLRTEMEQVFKGVFGLVLLVLVFATIRVALFSEDSSSLQSIYICDKSCEMQMSRRNSLLASDFTLDEDSKAGATKFGDVSWTGFPAVSAQVDYESEFANCDVLRRSLIHSKRCELDSERFTMPFLITGVGRSGTQFLSLAFQKLGMKVSHDSSLEGREGVVSWMDLFNGNNEWLKTHISKRMRCSHPSHLPDTWRYRHIFHLVRHPLKNIDSRWDRGLSLMNFAWPTRCHTVVDEGLDAVELGNANYTLVFTLRHWVLFNSFAEEISEWGFRNEDLRSHSDKIVNEVRRRVGLKAMSPQDFAALSQVDKNANSGHTKKTGAITWKRLCSLDHEYCMMAQLMSIRYGYRMSFTDLHPNLAVQLCGEDSYPTCVLESLPPKLICNFNNRHKWECKLPF